MKRFFGDGVNGNYIFLIDEAHNLLERGREMYSATLIKEEMLLLKNSLQDGMEDMGKTILYGQGFAHTMIKQLEKCNKEMLALKRECEEYRIVEKLDQLVQPLLRLQGTMESYLEENEEVEVPVNEELLDFYFKLSHFMEIYENT